MKTVLKYRKPLAIFSYIWYSYGNKNRSVSASLSRCGNGARKETSMHQREMFGEAKWICDPKAEGEGGFSVLRRRFSVTKATKATLRVVGLGFFHCYLNGQPITEDMFLPLSSDYEERAHEPVDEKLTGHRLYVPEFDVTPFLREGDNVLVLHFGGWYTFDVSRYGKAKAIYRLSLTDAAGERHIVSSEDDRMGDSFVREYYFTTHENQDYCGFDDGCFGLSCDDSSWRRAALAKPVQTEYEFTDCPPDRLDREIMPRPIGEEDGAVVYDCGCNMTG